MPAAIMRRVLFGAFTLTCMLTAAGLARAEVVNLKASMDAKSEVPPNSSPATGTGDSDHSGVGFLAHLPTMPG